jgi:hypothetical protein
LEPIEWTPDGWFHAKGGTLSKPIVKPIGGPGGVSGYPLTDDFSTDKFGVQAGITLFYSERMFCGFGFSNQQMFTYNYGQEQSWMRQDLPAVSCGHAGAAEIETTQTYGLILDRSPVYRLTDHDGCAGSGVTWACKVKTISLCFRTSRTDAIPMACGTRLCIQV